MRKDPTEFRERFLRWKKGEQVYENGLALPAYEDGLTPHKKSEVNTNLAIYNPEEDLYTGRYTLPEVTITGDKSKRVYHSHAPRTSGMSKNQYKLLTGDLLGAMTTGMNVLSPSLWWGAVRDANGLQDGFNRLMRGNSGFVTENFEREHPYISIGANLIGDAAILGGPSGVKNLNQSVNKSKMKTLNSDAKLTAVNSRLGTPPITMTDTQWDAAYNAALKSEDMVEALRLRDLHFKAKAPNTPVVDINGNPQLVYHKTPEKFTVFDNNRSIGKLNWFATPNAYGENGVFATGAGKDPHTMKLYVNMKNPHKPTIDEGIESAYIAEGEDGILGIVDRNMTNYFHSSNKAGKGFMMSGGVDNPFALKSADAITYDDAGKIIPLSKRDNFNINDIRYGLVPWLIGTGTFGTLYGASNKTRFK